jgi:hypothetical protein
MRVQAAAATVHDAPFATHIGPGITTTVSVSASVGNCSAWGEDERLAQVVRSLARRADLEPYVFDGWLAASARAHRELWAEAPSIDPVRFAAVQNAKLVLRSAYVALSLDASLPAPGSSAVRALGDTLARMQ